MVFVLTTLRDAILKYTIILLFKIQHIPAYFSDVVILGAT